MKTRIIVITGMFPKYDRNGYKTGEFELGVSHGVDEHTLETVCLPCVRHPSELGATFCSELGATFCSELGEWIL